MQRYDEAIEYAKKCLAIREMANEKMGTAYSRNLVALTLEETALFMLEHGNNPEEHYSFTMRAINYREKIANETHLASDYDKLATTYYNLGITVKGHRTQGLMLKEALSIWEDIADQTGKPDYQEGIKRAKDAIKYYNLEDICYPEE